MKEHIEELLSQALLHLIRDGVLSADCDITPQLERTRSPEHGEFASNIAMVLAKRAGLPPAELAQNIVDKMPRSRQLDHAEIAGPGFINFHMNQVALTTVVKDILYHADSYGHIPPDPRQEVTVEFAGKTVSAKTGADGRFEASLPEMAADGQSHTMTIKADETVKIQDVLIGEVWICSGQSNMQWAVSQANDADLETGHQFIDRFGFAQVDHLTR